MCVCFCVSTTLCYKHNNLGVACKKKVRCIWHLKKWFAFRMKKKIIKKSLCTRLMCDNTQLPKRELSKHRRWNKIWIWSRTKANGFAKLRKCVYETVFFFCALSLSRSCSLSFSLYFRMHLYIYVFILVHCWEKNREPFLVAFHSICYCSFVWWCFLCTFIYQIETRFMLQHILANCWLLKAKPWFCQSPLLFNSRPLCKLWIILKITSFMWMLFI